jgi:pimeloyl-ACP methyl ester carboxylesterase
VRCLAGEDCHEGYLRMVPPGEIHENEVPAQILLKIGLYRPTTEVAAIKVPVQIFAARQDSLIPIAAVEKAARKIPQCELLILDMGHFDPYFGETFETVSKAQTEFLNRHLH